MRITDVTTTVLHNPDVPAVQDATMPPPPPGSGGRSQLFVHIHTDEGVEGLGVGQASPGIRQVIEHGLKDLLIDQDPFDIEKHWNAMFWRVRGYGRKGLAFCALSAVDIGLWDLKAKALGLPLFKLLGPFRDSVPIYGSGGWTNFTVDELIAEATGWVDQGIKRVKIKVGKDFGQSEGEDIQRLEAVRRAVGDDVAIYVDANNGYYPKQAIYMAKEFERYQVGWFEEPVLADDIDGLARVSAATSIPVATGEHEYTKYGFKELDLQGRSGHRSARRRSSRRRHRVDESGPPGPQLRSARGSALGPARSPPPSVRDAQPESRRGLKRRSRRRSRLVHRVPRPEGRDVGALPRPSGPGVEAGPGCRRTVQRVKAEEIPPTSK